MHPPQLSSMRRGAGFTLLEVMITLVIVSVLATIAVPSFKSAIDKNGVSTESSSLMTDLMLARAEAIRTANPVTVCVSTDGATCTGTSWHAGRIIFTDLGVAGSVDGADRIMQRSAASKTGTTIKLFKQSDNSAQSKTFIQFSGDGTPDVTSGVYFTTCRSGAAPVRAVVQPIGRVSMNKPTGTCP